MTRTTFPLAFDCVPGRLAERLMARDRRVMLFGQPGIGKTTLASGLAAHLDGKQRAIWCVGADPSSPAFGMPGAVCVGRWRNGDWTLVDSEALCTLDAARFRLPLLQAVATLAGTVREGSLLLEAPGVVRGVAAAELLVSLAQAAAIDLVLVLLREGQPPPLGQELESLGVEVVPVRASAEAHRPGKMTRARSRTLRWNRHLEGGVEHRMALADLHLVGTPPRNAAEAWLGKQVAFLDRQRTRSMGEVTDADETRLCVMLPPGREPTGTLLVRDACRADDGVLITGKPFAEAVVRYVPPADVLPNGLAGGDGGVMPLVHAGAVIATLMNGVFGDPLLHLRLGHQRRSLLFDLGEGSRLPARIAHQVTDVFISHAHMDHISGFLWLLRSRIGESSVCRIYGPPGIADHVRGLISGIHWDRIADRGPKFEVAELHGEVLRRFRLQAGLAETQSLENKPVLDGVVLREPEFLVRAAVLDHGTPVLAFAFEPAFQINVRKEQLIGRQWAPGPWLNELKRHIAAGDRAARIALPEGRTATVEELAEELTLITPGANLVYATDFADTEANRRKVINLARDAHTLFCEASFLEEQRGQAARTGHLTARACGEIANETGTRYLVPFHFSRRYEERPWRIYDEIAAVCPRVVIPKRDPWIRAAGDA